MTDQRLILIEDLQPGIVRLTLHDPARRNAMSEAMAKEFRAVIRSLQPRQELKVLILTGSGTSFSAGGDFQLLTRCSQLPVAETQDLMRQFYAQFLSITELDVVTIAAINGPAMGAGLCLALACDLRVADLTTKLALNFARLALHPGMGATYFLPRLVGPARAADLLLTGRTISGEDAERIGLVNRAVASAEVEQTTLELAESIANTDLTAIRLIKKTLRQSWCSDLETMLLFESFAQGTCYETQNYREIISGFDRRK